MQAARQRLSGLSGLCAAALCAAVLWPTQAHALFGDDEARQAILELRRKVDANQAASEAARSEGDAATRRSLLELSNQIEQLRGELARLRQVEPLKVELDGQSFTAQPAEKTQFDAAMDTLRRSEFAAASAAYTAFLRQYPSSGYTPSALYWLGNAQYAARAYKDSAESHRRLVSEFPNHPRTPEAMLAMANSQVELKDAKAARRTLEDLAKKYPQSEAAAAAKERLARLR